jgi:ABC-2 type transport system permease protein
MLARLLALALKEFLTLLRDKKSRVVIIVPPLIQLIVFGYAASYDLNQVPYAVYDRDGGYAARTLLAGFSGSANFHLVQHIEHEEQVAELLDARDVMLVIRIAPRFTAELASGGSGRVQVLIDGRNSNTAQVARGYAAKIVNRFNEQWSAQHGRAAYPVHLVTRAWYNPNLESRWFFVSGLIGVLTLVVTMLTTAMSVAREREQGTFDQLLVTPLSPLEILIGKSLPSLLIGTVLASLVITLAVFWFQVPLQGSLATLYCGIVLFLFAAVGVGLFISSLAVTLQQALLGGFLFMVPAVILSGFATPIANMPAAVQVLTYANPVRYYLIILRSIFLEGANIDLLIHQMWPLALIALVTLSAAGWLFRRRMY